MTDRTQETSDEARSATPGPLGGGSGWVPHQAIVGGRWGDLLAVLTFTALALVWAGIGAGRTVRGPPYLLIAFVTLLPYTLLTLTAWSFALWSMLPDRRGPPLFLLAFVATAAGLWGPSWNRSTEETAGVPVTTMTWNVRRLWGGPDDGDDPTACVIDVIKEADPDVLTLLEVSQDNVDALEAALSMTCRHGTYRPGQGPTRGGLATCSRGDDWRLTSGSPQAYVDEDDWQFVLSEVAHADQTVNVLAVHLSPYAFRVHQREQGLSSLVDLGRTGEAVVRAQGAQAVALLDRVTRFQDPTVVAGDFNSTRDTWLHVALRHHLTDAWEHGGLGFGATTRFANWIPLRIDYVYVTDALGVVDTSVVQAGCSDHRPIVSRLVLRPSPRR